jgi:hypothetical protein
MIGLLLCAASVGARAQGNLIERQIKAGSGREVRVGIYSDIRSDCTSGPLPAIKLLSSATHGRVTVKRGTLKATNFMQCLATEVPVFVVVYRANQNFNGTDEFELEISFPGGRKQIQHIKVSVSPGAGSGQDI